MDLIAAQQLFHEGSLVLADLSHNGICIDKGYYKKQYELLSTEMQEKAAAVLSWSEVKALERVQGKPFNIESPKQLIKLLFDVMGLEVLKRTDKGNPSVDEDILTVLGKTAPFVKEILRYRKCKKIRDTYISGFLREAVDGVLHTSFNLHIPRTFRSSSSAPNMQNVSKHDKRAQEICRKGIKPRKGDVLLEADFSGAEVRVGVSYHKDQQMVKYITDPTTDMHRDCAKDLSLLNDAQVTKDIRYLGKNGFVFPEFYGSYFMECAPNLWEEMLEEKLADGKPLKKHLYTEGIRNYIEFEEHVKEVEHVFWDERFMGYAQWKKETYNWYLKHGYIDSFTGFRFSGHMKRNDVLNYPIQSAAFHCLLWCLIQVNKRLKKEKLRSVLVGQIHDSIIASVHPEELEYVCAMLRQVMCVDLLKHWEWVLVPMDIDISVSEIDGNWFEMRGLI